MPRTPTICLTFLILGLIAAPATLADECQDCHRSSVFKVRYKALYDHHVGYETSVHGLAGLSCVDCHGGDPETKDKDVAHIGVRERVGDSQTPTTCGRCHDMQFEAFVDSDHYQATADDRNALNCVTCHGSMEMDVTFVGRIHRRCMKCHDKSDDPHSVDVLADELLSRINVIAGYHSEVRSAAPGPADLATIDETFDRLVRQWHGMDLEAAVATSRELLEMLREARNRTP
ncbi:MAG: hypothetical protein GY838_14665 [bacterium]|nr:hypothetical protein [bacterium]